MKAAKLRKLETAETRPLSVFGVEIPKFALSSFLIALSRAVRLGRKEHACLGASILRERASSIGSSTEVPSLLLTIPCFPEDWPNTGRALWVGWAFLGAFLPFSPSHGQRKWILVFPKPSVHFQDCWKERTFKEPCFTKDTFRESAKRSVTYHVPQISWCRGSSSLAETT